MKKNIINNIKYIFLIVFLLYVGKSFAQPVNMPINYIRENTYTTENNVSSIKYTYFDGLGRELQNIESFANFSRIISFTSYDSFGRVRRNNLPYVSMGTAGYDYQAFANHSGYYSVNYNSSYAFSEMVYDQTTANNVIEQSLPGESWRVGGGHTLKTTAINNTKSDNLREYIIENDTTVFFKGYYENNKILRKETIDPQGDKKYGYYDITDKLIAEEHRTDSVSLFTYYLYDDFGLIKYIIPPMQNYYFKIGERKNLTSLKSYCYYTKYDERHRPFKVYIPGAGCTTNLYDKKDRLVLSQNEVMRTENKWIFTKYDNLNRPVISGICTGNEIVLRFGLAAQTVFNETRGTFAHGYTNQAFPTFVNGDDYLTVTYYDNYDWQGDSPEASSVGARQDADFTYPVNEKVVGLVTGTKRKILGIEENKWLYSANYFDDKYNEIQAVKQLYPDGLERTLRNYNFVGNVTREKQVQTINFAEVGYDRFMEYDILQRLTEVKQRVIGSVQPQEFVSIAKYTYNNLWQITEKTNHNAIDTTKYLYSIDGKLIGAESPLFSYKLYFDKKPGNMSIAAYPRYDGNVSMMEWNNGGEKKGYRYEYDGFKQLAFADLLSVAGGTSWVRRREYFEGYITYDLNGNIKTLKRTNSTGEYSFDTNNIYGGNQLLLSNINGVFYNYIYDKNGNLTFDRYKGINFTYNILNLPEKIFAGTDEISYIYTSAGEKIATKTGDSYTYYRGSFIYNDSQLDHMIFPEGIVRKASGGFVYYYAKKDHIGSTRVLCYDAGGIMNAVQTTDYYPFGLSFSSNGTNYNRYLFSGKELQDQVLNGNKLALYDFGARHYDPAIGRWFNIDPALQFTNPYMYCANNPMNYIDPDGKKIVGITKLDAENFRDDIYNVLADNKFSDIRTLIDIKGKTFNVIDVGKLSSAMESIKLTNDERAYINMVTGVINSEDLYKVEYVNGQFTSSEGAQAFVDHMNTLGDGIGDKMVTSDKKLSSLWISNLGDGLNVPISKGSHSFISGNLHDKDRAVTSGHEVFGHGIPAAGKLSPAENNANAIRTDNLIRRILGLPQRDGNNHGGFKEGHIINPYNLPII